VQSAHAVALLAGAAVPAAHEVHVFAETAEKLPALQGAQEVAWSRKVPAAQLVHAVDADGAEYAPEAHGGQLEAPVALW